MEEIELMIEELYRKVITEVGAVKTGRMRDSITANVFKENDNYIFTIDAVYYFVYVDNYYGITDRILADPQFKIITDALTDLMINDFLKTISN